MHRLLANEIEPMVSKVKDNINKLPEAAAKVRSLTISSI